MKMWIRSELKGRAKWVLGQCYWKAVLVSLILFVIMGGTVGQSNYVRDSISNQGGFGKTFLMIGALMMVWFIVTVIGICVNIFFFKPLEVNARRFFIISRVQPAELNEIGHCFKNSYINVVKTQFLRSLFTFLWSLLFLVPGIIKAYEYRMIPYILAEDPGLDYKEAFRISRDMMYGEKWNAFVLDLSFIGWGILSMLTCGVLGVFYVNPYRDLTNAELYDVLKNKYFRASNGSTV